VNDRRAAVPLLGWAAFLTVLTVVLWLWTSDPLPPSLFSGAAVLAWALGLYLLVRPGTRRPPARRLPELSLSAAVIAVGLTLLAVGAVVGVWLVLIACGVLVLGLGLAGREQLAARRVS
jgi:hypothetical protein